MPVEILKTARPGTAGVVSRARRCTPLKSGFPGQGDSVIQRPLRAPKHLKPPTRRWWLAVHAVFELEEHHARLLTPAGEAWDRAAAAREAIEKHGITYTDRFGAPRSRPEIAVERDSRIAFARLLRELRLDVEPDDPRLPGLNGGRHPRA
jgi:phage terminase small subunit